MAADLPIGFTLDEPPQQKPAGGLPPGFSVDPPSFMDRFKGAAGTVGSALLASNPLMATRIAPEADKQLNEATRTAGYSAGGSVTDLLAGHVSPELAGRAGYLANIYTQSLPVIAGTWLGGQAGQSLKEPAKDLMWSAVKPTLADQQKGKAARAVKTLLEEGVSPTKGGVNKLRTMAEKLTPEIEQAVAQSPERISKAAVADRLRQTSQQFENQVNPTSDLRAVENAWTEFMQHPQLAGKTDMSAQLAHKLKQGTYQQLGSKPYGELQGAATEAQKALARGLREEVAKAVPSVVKPLARQSDLYNALNVAERRALMDLNKNPAGLALIAPNKAQLAAFLADKSAAFKALLARMMYSGGETMGEAAGGVTGGVIGARSGRDE